MNTKAYRLFVVAAMALLAVGCKTPQDITYFQDAENGEKYEIKHDLDIRLRNNDKVNIVVHSRDAQLSQMFNLAVQSQRIGSVTGTNTANQMSVYTVDNSGCIDFPTLGSVQVAGKNREEVANIIKSAITEKNLLKDPVVIVEFDNMFINVLGEVNKPGRYALTKDRVSVIDALGMAGDLTLQGLRKNVMVLRVEDGARKAYHIDLTKVDDLVNSPAYYMQQDDVVMVEPNNYKKRQTTVNGNNVRSTSFYMSIVSVLTSVASLIVAITR